MHIPTACDRHMSEKARAFRNTPKLLRMLFGRGNQKLDSNLKPKCTTP